MKKCLLFIFCICAAHLNVPGQSSFILAGQDTGLMYTVFSYPELMFEAADYSVDSFGIDIDNDGIIDIQLQYLQALYPANDGVNYLAIAPQHSGVQFPGIYDTVENNALGGNIVYRTISDFNLNDTITNTNQGINWLDSSSYVFYYNSDMTPTSVGVERAFVGGRIINGNDTSLFYIHFGFFYPDSGQYFETLRLYDYAIQGIHEIITIPTSIGTVTNMTPISVYPNPFHDQISFTHNQLLEFTIIDYSGRAIMQGKSDKMIKTEELASGEYALILRNDEINYIVKIVKY